MVTFSLYWNIVLYAKRGIIVYFYCLLSVFGVVYYKQGGENMKVENRDVLAKNLKRYISMSGKDRKEIAQEIGCPYSTFTDWVNGNKYPRINSIEKMAVYFGISKSDLIEDFEEKQKDNDALAAIIVQLRMNKELLEVVGKLVTLDKAKLESLTRLLDTFI